MDNDYVVIVDGELYHYGTKGMKWGRRLFQNKDGSLTALGKKRYLNSDGTLNKAGKKMRKEEADALKAREAAVKKRESEARSKARQDAKKAELDAREKALDNGKVPKTTKAAQKAAAAETKSMSEMSNAELKAAVERKKAENEYRQYFPEKVPKGKEFAQKMLNEAIIPAAVKGGKDFMEKALNRIAEKALADKVDPNSIEGLKKIKEKLSLKKDIKNLTEGTVDERTKEYDLLRKKQKDSREDAAYDEGAENRKLKRLEDQLNSEDRINKIYDARKTAAATAAEEKAKKKLAEHQKREAERKAKADAKKARQEAERKAKEDAAEYERSVTTSRSRGDNALMKRLGYSAEQRMTRNGQNSAKTENRNSRRTMYDREYDGMDYVDVIHFRRPTSSVATNDNVNRGQEYLTSLKLLPLKKDDD